MGKTFERDDKVLAHLVLEDPCQVKIVVTEGEVHLWVGPRDWLWDIETLELIGCGTKIIEEGA